MIRDNIFDVQERIKEACRNSGKDPQKVTLIAVSKTKPIEVLKEAYDSGIRDFGENKVQELTEKAENMPKDIRWHMIGHLQRNKVKYIIDKVFLIHSVDSYSLACQISREAVKRKLTVDILLEVNVAEEESKFGTTADNAEELYRQAAALDGIRIRGLMTVAPYTDTPEENRKYFTKLKQLAVDIAAKNIDNDTMCIHSMDILSMGMTGDYETAVEEGATCVRVGTGIFGARDYSV